MATDPNIEKFKRYAGEGKHYAFGAKGSEEHFYFEGLPTSDFAETLVYFNDIQKVYVRSKRKYENEVSELVKGGMSESEAKEQVVFSVDLERTTLERGIKLIRKMVVQSNPDMGKPENEKVLDGFIRKNFPKLQEALQELNADFATDSVSEEKLRQIRELQERVQGASK